MLLSVLAGETIFQLVPAVWRYGFITLFFAGWTVKSYLDYRDWKSDDEDAVQPKSQWWAQAWKVALMFAIAEFGDKSMFAAGGAVAKSGESWRLSSARGQVSP